MEPNDPSPITVTAYPFSYNIYIGNYLKSGLHVFLSKYYHPASKIIVVYDKNLKHLYLPLLHKAASKLNTNLIAIPFIATEKNKSLKAAQKLLTLILSKGINRKSVLISLGGGITGDIVGFIAATILRGISFINIPTTLLAAVDSSIGGKNGVNHTLGKNLIGTFYNPKAVIIDPLFFSSLSTRELLAGFAEVIKCALINNAELFNYLYNNHHLLLQNNQNFLQNILQNAISTKKYLVEKDFLDLNNQRALLNLGHTFGHALELINGYKKSLLHGEAVAIGICLAAKFSNHIGLLDISKTNKIIKLIEEVKLSSNYKSLKSKKIQNKLVTAMLKDKKNNNTNINLILLKDIGNAVFVPNISQAEILSFLQKEYK